MSQVAHGAIAYQKPYSNVFGIFKNSSRKKTTVDEEEIAKFGQLGSHWWDPNGEMAPLHSMNKLRVSFIKKALLQEKQPKNSAKPLQGLRILDVGCGGGILSEVCKMLKRIKF